MPERVWTVGHSTLSLQGMIDLLTAHRIEAVADVRRYPGSRRFPHFAGDALSRVLAARGLIYVSLPALGGRRRPAADSVNTAWRSLAFRGYADYMATDAFAAGLDDLANLACGLRTSMLCAEAVWWRCHRGLIADALKWFGFDVVHILGQTVAPHPYTAAAAITRGRLSYRSSP